MLSLPGKGAEVACVSCCFVGVFFAAGWMRVDVSVSRRQNQGGVDALRAQRGEVHFATTPALCGPDFLAP